MTAKSDKTFITVTFTATSSSAVLAWGGHIASQLDWGLGNSASAINGSPYHMYVEGWSLTNAGQQDRLSREARSMSLRRMLASPRPIRIPSARAMI